MGLFFRLKVQGLMGALGYWLHSHRSDFIGRTLFGTGTVIPLILSLALPRGFEPDGLSLVGRLTRDGSGWSPWMPDIIIANAAAKA